MKDQNLKLSSTEILCLLSETMCTFCKRVLCCAQHVERKNSETELASFPLGPAFFLSLLDDDFYVGNLGAIAAATLLCRQMRVCTQHNFMHSYIKSERMQNKLRVFDCLSMCLQSLYMHQVCTLVVPIVTLYTLN